MTYHYDADAIILTLMVSGKDVKNLKCCAILLFLSLTVRWNQINTSTYETALTLNINVNVLNP